MPDGLCAGRPVPEIEVELIRPHDGPVELSAGGWSAWKVSPGEVGEVVVAGEHVLSGYLDDPESDRENKIQDGGRVWHRTGDGARFDAAGRLWLVGRISQRVQRAGVTWWSLPVELRAASVPGVEHAAYLGLSDPALGQRAALCVETRSGVLDEATRSRVRAAMAPAPLDELHVLSRIPRDPRHRSKTDLRRLVEQLGVGTRS